MRFFYFSSLSWVVYGFAMSIAITLLSLFWTKAFNLKITNPVYWLLVVAILVGPWTEELWIARNFDQLCRKDAGVFIHKVVEVDGYYDATGTITRIVGRPPYKFVESPEAGGKYRRIEPASAQERLRAIEWYAANKHRQPGEKEWFTYPASDELQVAVEMDTGYTWRVTKIGKPTARYRYESHNSHGRVAHQIRRLERVVIDDETKEILGRYTDYSRGPYWFFIGPDVATMQCAEVAGKSPLVYPSVLKVATGQ